MSFRCTVVTPEAPVLDEIVKQAIIPAHDGLIGIETGRSPMLAQLGLGALRVDLPNGEKRLYYIEGGVAQMKDNKLTILTQQAMTADEISATDARAEYAEASAMKNVDEAAFKERQRRLARARAMQHMASLP